MSYILIKLSGGIVDDVSFYEDPALAVKKLVDYVRKMDLQDDAALYGPDGMIANAKTFLDENDEFTEDGMKIIHMPSALEEPLYIIGNPNHHLGFIVASFDDPMGYRDPVEALSSLGQMRKDYGNHLNLYRVTLVAGKIAGRRNLEFFNADCAVEDFDYSLISEYLE